MKALTRKLVPFEVKAIQEVDRTFEGIFAAFTLDLGGDVIHPGAFTKTLSFWSAQPTSVPLLDQHNKQSIHDVLGSMVEAEEKSDGVWGRFEVDEGPEGDKLIRHLKRGRLGGLSIGYEAVAPERDSKGIRHLKEIKLHEVSAVIWPMNPDAVVDASSIKSWSSADLSALSEEELEAARTAIEVEAKARRDAVDPPLSPEEADALRARLLSVRLRPILSRHGGVAA
jgi:HK97 family phage prohead protease